MKINPRFSTAGMTRQTRLGDRLCAVACNMSFVAFVARNSVTTEIARVGGHHYVVQRHSRQYVQKPVCDFLLVNNTSLRQA